MKQYSNRSLGFTLIELLITIAVLGILTIAALTALNVISTLGKANLAKAKAFSASIEHALYISQVGKWSFEEGSGTTAKDTSGYGNDGTLSGAPPPTWQTVSQCGLGFGGCIKFDGLNYITVPPKQFAYTGGDLTISLWVNPAEEGEILSKPWDGSGNYNYRISWGGTNKISVCVGGLLCTAGFTTPESFSKGSWHHIVVVFASSKKVTIYVDGKVSVQGEHGITVWTVGDGVELTMARVYPGAGGGLRNGLIDELSIYNQALTAYQIREIYAEALGRHQLARQESKLD